MYVMNVSTLYFAEWKEHFDSDVFSFYHLCCKRDGVSIDFSVVVKEDLTYRVSFQGTVIEVFDCCFYFVHHHLRFE